MPTKTLDVLARFRTSDRELVRGISRGIVRTRQLDRSISSVNRGLMRMGSLALGVAGVGGVVYGMQRAASAAFGMKREVESATLGIASMLESAGRVDDFSVALSRAKGIMADLRRDAAALPGTFSELRQSFSTLLPSLAPLGASTNLIRDLATKAVVAGKVQSVFGGAETVARDIRQLLAGIGAANQINTPSLQANAKAIAELARQDKVAALIKIGEALRVSPGALEAYGRSGDAVFSTLQDNALRFSELVATPAYEYAIERATALNEQFETSRDRVLEISHGISQDMVKALKGAEALVRGVVTHWGEVKALVIGLAESYIAVKLVGAIQRVTLALAGPGGFLAALSGGLTTLTAMGVAAAAIAANLPDNLRDSASAKGVRVVGGQDVLTGLVSGTLSGREERAAINAVRGHITERRANQSAYRRLVEGTPLGLLLNAPKAGSDREEAIRIIRSNEKAASAAAAAVFSASLYDQKRNAEFSRAGFRPAGGLLGRKVELPDEDITKPRDPRLRKTVFDFRGSQFRIEQRFDEGDPDRIYLQFRRDVVGAVLPRVGSTLAPA